MTVNGFSSAKRRIQDLKDDIEDEVNEAVEDNLEQTERRGKRNIVEADAVASTEMYRSFVRESVDMRQRTRHTLTNVSQHGPLQEWGTGDYWNTKTQWGFGAPPEYYESPDFSLRLVAAIEEWITIKPGFRMGGPDRETAVSIARSIAEPTEDDPLTGTPPQPFMRPAWFIQKPQLKADVRAAVRRALRRV